MRLFWAGKQQFAYDVFDALGLTSRVVTYDPCEGTRRVGEFHEPKLELHGHYLFLRLVNIKNFDVYLMYPKFC